MSGRSYKKVKKDDKNKKKLKTALKNVSTKTNLPKGQNLTDTNFKVKKIVIKDQVKAHGPDEILFHKKLNVAELVARLGHHNTSIKHEALEGLKDLITNYPVEILGSHYIQVLEAIIKLILDDNSSLRKSSCKIVARILSEVASHKLVPFFASLNSYLLCGLTHIDRGVREDALLLMDACLKHVPGLCEKYSFNLLSVCLDLISDKGVDSRTLSLNLESSQVVTKWRLKVLERINSLLDCLLKAHDRVDIDSEQNTVLGTTFIPGDVNYFPVYSTGHFNGNGHDLEIAECADPSSQKLTIVGYAEAIIPLLMGMFLEVHPIDKSALESDLSTVINEECCKLLASIVGIMQSLRDLISKKPELHIPFRQVANKFSRALLQTLVSGRFPFAVSSKVSGRAPKEGHEGDSPSSIRINLSVARLVLAYTDNDNWEHVIPFLKNCFRITEQFTQSDTALFAACVSEICKDSTFSENSYFFSKAVQISLEGNSQLCPYFFRLLGSIALDPQMDRFHRNPSFEKWLASLPERVTKPRIQPYQLDIISKIAVRNFPSFLENLDVNVELILDQIPSVSIPDEKKKEAVQWQMATLLHWVQEWDEELTDSLRPAIENCFWGDRLTNYISEIIAMKTFDEPTQDAMINEPA